MHRAQPNKDMPMRAMCLSTALAMTTLALFVTAALPHPAMGQTVRQASQGLTLSIGRGTMVTMSQPIKDVFVADPAIADVQARSDRQIYIYAKAAGETSVFATSAAGGVVYSSNVRVGNNYDQLNGMLREAMPGTTIAARAMNGLVLLTGSVKSPDDVAEAGRITQAIVGDKTTVINRLQTATPMQVMLTVRIAEVSRDLLKQMGVNLQSVNGAGSFGFARGRDFITDTGAITYSDTASTAFLAKKFLGLNFTAALDLLETDGVVTTLAEPSLTAVSGETASFLAGGEFPIPIQQSLGTTTIEYKQYGVGLAFTPTVLGDGRISMRVRPEVSELTDAGSVKFGGYTIPAIATRRAETTVELGSGQSFVIGGLLKNVGNNSIDKTPWLGDLPIIGALFRSTQFRRQESELVIVVTPYLVKPVSGRIALPTDGAMAPTDAENVLGGQSFTGRTGTVPPSPHYAPEAGTQPAPALPATVAPGGTAAAPAAPAPGFSLN